MVIIIKLISLIIIVFLPIIITLSIFIILFSTSHNIIELEKYPQIKVTKVIRQFGYNIKIREKYAKTNKRI